MDEKSSITGEIEKRLDALFREDNDVSVPEESPEEIESSPLLRVKEIILSIDWEITDSVLASLIDEVQILKASYSNDRIISLFLDLIESVGKYISKNKANSHPDAIRLMNSIYRSLERTALNKDLTESQKRKELFVQIDRFKKLKTKIAEQRREERKEEIPKIRLPEKEEVVKAEASEETPEVESPPRVEEEPPVDFRGMAPHEAFAFALEEIRKLIKAEFQALRAELKLWRETRG